MIHNGPRSLINQYKRQDVFRCVHESHAHFDGRVSVHHVLREKGCYPGGCLYFLWRCRLLNKGSPCPRKYEHVGRKCFGCKDYYDEKVNNHPDLLLDDESYKEFIEELRLFEEWLQDVRGREISFLGTVRSVKPMLTRMTSRKHESMRFEGYLVCFAEGYFDMLHLQDACYLVLRRGAYQRHRFGRDDRLEFRCLVKVDRGRILLTRPRGIEIEERGEGPVWNETEARVAARTGTVIAGQPEPCMACERGCLVDVIGDRERGPGRRRELVCLEGQAGPEGCPFRIEKLMVEYRCVRDEMEALWEGS